MDEVTQQNSALVEENAATAKTLEQQSQAMDEQVSLFRVDDRATATARQVVTPMAARTAAPAAKPAAAPRAPVPQKRVAAGGGRAAAFDSNDWKEF
jgi:hypothetical protein